MPKISKLLINLGVMLVSILIIFIILEICIRLFIPCLPMGPSDKYIYDPYTNYKLKPNQRHCIADTDFKYDIKINSLGLRDNEIVKEDNSTFRILSLGDSYAFGAGLNLEETYAKKLEKKLNLIYNIEVINAGVGGYGTKQEVEYLKHHGVELKPNLVILQFYGGNDIENSNGMREYTVVNGMYTLKKTADNLNLFRRLKLKLINKSKLMGILAYKFKNMFSVFQYKLDKKSQVYQLDFMKKEYTPENEQRFEVVDYYFSELAELSKKNNFSVILLIIPPNYQANQELFTKMIRIFGEDTKDYNPYKMGNYIESIGEKYNFTTINMMDEFSYNAEKYYFEHDGHLNGKGHYEVAIELTKAILSSQYL